MESATAIVGSTTLALKLAVVESYVKRYKQREDLAVESSQPLERLQDQHTVALQLVESIEQQDLDRINFFNQDIRSRLRIFKSTLANNKTRLESLSDQVRNASALSRVKRANAIIRQCKSDVEDFNGFVSETVLQSLKTDAADVFESYVPANTAPPNPPRLTLDYNTTATCEGKLRAAILDRNSRGVVGVVASGLGGVGKTCALRGLADDVAVKERFPDGILFIQLGNDAGIADLISGVARMVERTGGVRLAGTIRVQRGLSEAVDKAAPWFEKRKCLLLVDDIWWVNGITSDVFRVLGAMLQRESVLVYTTRDQKFLQRADKVVRFEPADAHGDLARSMLMRHAGFDSDVVLSEPNKLALNGVLDICGGLPLALGIAGSTIQSYRVKRETNPENALIDYHRNVELAADNIIDSDSLGYGPLSLMVDSSLQVLDSEDGLTSPSGFKQTFDEMFRALCVLRKQEKARGCMLQKLWDLKSVLEARQVAERMAEVSLVQMSIVAKNSFYVRVHDVVVDLAKCKASERYEVKSHFATLANNYMRKDQSVDAKEEVTATANENGASTPQPVKCDPIVGWVRNCFGKQGNISEDPDVQLEQREIQESFRSWWDVEDDGYIVDNVCRILHGAGEGEEVLWLLGRVQWVIPRLQNGGINAVEEDLRIAQEVARTDSGEQTEVLKYLDIVRRAARMSCNAVVLNRYEAWFQFYGRVAWFAKQCKRTRALLQDIERRAPRPWVKPAIGFLHEAGGAALESTFTDHRTLCVSHGKDIIRFVQTGYDRHVVSAVEYDRRHGTQVRYALVLGLRLADSVSGDPSHDSDEGVEEEVQCFCAAFSSDMRKVVTGYADGSIVFWDIESGYELDRRLCDYCDGCAVKCIALSGDGSKVFCGTSNGAVHVLSYESDGDVRSATAAVTNGKQVVCLAASWDARRAVWALDDGRVRMWDSNRGEAVEVAAEVEAFFVLFVAVSADGRRVVCGTRQGVVLVWDVDSTETSVRTMAGHSHWVGCVTISRGGRVVSSGSSDYSVRLWNPENGEMIGQPLIGHKGAITCVALSADCTETVSASAERTLRVWDVRKDASISCEGERFATDIMSFAYGGNGTRAAFGSRDGSIRWLDVESGELVGEPLRGHTADVHLVALSNDGGRVVSASADGTVRVWDANSGDAVGAPIAGLVAASVAVSNDGTRAFVGCDDGMVRVCDTESGGVSAVLVGHTDVVLSVTLSSDGIRLASGSADSTVRMWDVHKCAPVAPPLEIHTDWVSCVAWAADGTRLLSASYDRTVRLWDVATGQVIATPLWHSAPVVYALLDARCSRLVSYDYNSYGRLWDMASGQCITTSSHREWAQTLHRLSLASFRVNFYWLVGMQLVARNVDDDEQMVARADRRTARIGDKFFAAVHSPSSVPFCEICYAP